VLACLVAAYAWGVRRAGNLRVEEMFDSVPVPWHEIDRQGVIRRVNRAECDLLGYDREELIGRPAADLVASEQQAAAHDAVRRGFEGRTPLKPLIREYIRRDGSCVRACAYEAAVRDRHGSVVALRSALVNVAELLRLEKQARESEQRHRLLLEKPPAVESAGEVDRQAEPVASGLRILGREATAEAERAGAAPDAPALPR